MSLISGDLGSKSVFPDGLQVDHLSENTVGHGVSVPGRTSGVATETGYVGEKISATLAGISQASPVASTWYDDSGTLSLSAGIWSIYCSTHVYGANPGSISGAVVPILVLGLRTGSTVIQDLAVAAGAVNGVSFYGPGNIVQVVNITTTTVYKVSIAWLSNSGSASMAAISSGAAMLGSSSTSKFLYAVRIA